MSARRLALAALAWACLSGAADAQAPHRLAGAWNVEYLDGALGVVRGRAYVDRDGRAAELELVDPGSASPRTLRSRSLTVDGDRVEVVFEGEGVRAARMPFEPIGERAGVAPAARSVPLKLGNGSADVKLLEPKAADRARVVVRLGFAGESTLTGAWTMRVDATTGRDGAGGGRVGTGMYAYDTESGGALVSGGESWTRPKSVIALAFPILDQLDATAGTPLFPEPYDSKGLRTYPVTHRDLLVVGRDLPRRWRELPRVAAEGAGVEYAVQSLDEDRAKSAQVRRMFELGLERAQRGLPPDAYAKLVRDHDLLIVRASLRPGARPGPQAFRLNGALAGWRLQYGDYTGTMRFVRPLGGDRFDPVDYAFVPESLAVEIHADRRLPYDELAVTVGVDGKLGLADGTRVLAARRVPGDPRRYRTALVSVGSSFGSALGQPSLAVAAGGIATAQLAEPSLVAVSPGQARIAALAAPIDVRAHLLRKPREVGVDWRAAVATAASCARLPDADPDADRVTTAQADRYLSVGVVTMTVYRTPVAVGEHAAMLLLRASFVDLLQGARDAMAVRLDARGLDAFGATLAPALRVASRPAITRVDVTMPDGRRSDVAGAFSDETLRDRHRLEGDALVAWRRQAMAEARAGMVAAMDRALERASAVGDCDIDALLGLTGREFETVTRHARMLAVRPEGGRYVPHARALAWLERVPNLAERVRAEKAVQSDELAIVQFASFFAFLPASASELPAVLAASLVVDTTDFAYSAYREVATQAAESRELAFALGASTVLGERRYEEAMAADTTWVAGALATGLAGVAAVGSGAQLWHVARLRSSAQREAELSGLARHLTPSGFRTLDSERQGELFALMSAARRIADRAGVASLTPGERRFYDLADRLAPRIDPLGRPDWARSMDPAAWRRIAHMAGRDDVARLFAQDAANMERYALDDDGLHALHAPQESIADFEREVANRKRRVKPQGPAFYAQMHSTTGAKPPEVFVHTIYAENKKALSSANISLLSGEASGSLEYASFLRLLDRGGEGGAGKGTIVLMHSKINRANGAPGWVTGLARPLVAGRGVPMFMYGNLRAFQALGIAYADPSIGAVKMSSIVNIRTSIQLRWLEASHPGKPLDELVRYTDSYDYARSALEQAGFRIVRARVTDYSLNTNVGAQLEDDYFDAGLVPAVNESADAFKARAVAARRAFASRHGLGDDAGIGTWYDIVLDVEPLAPGR